MWYQWHSERDGEIPVPRINCEPTKREFPLGKTSKKELILHTGGLRVSKVRRVTSIDGKRGRKAANVGEKRKGWSIGEAQSFGQRGERPVFADGAD